MKFRKQRGLTASLVLAAHPLPATALTLGLAGAAALSGRTGVEVALVAGTVLVGQVTVGWVNDVADRRRDRAVGRQDKPVAMGWVDAGTVRFATACAVLLLVPLSIANGTAAGIAHLLAVAAGWLSNVWFRRTVLSWLPSAVSFALLPAFLSYGGLGGGMHGGPPTIEITVQAGLLGIGVHFLSALPDLVEDRETGVTHLPLRVALRIGAPRLLVLTSLSLLLVATGLALTALTVGLRQ